MPFGAAKVEETQVTFLFAKCMCIDAKRHRGVRVPELLGGPLHALAGGQRETRKRVAGIVEAKRANTSLWELPSQPVPGAIHVPFVERPTRFRAEDVLGDFREIGDSACVSDPRRSRSGVSNPSGSPSPGFPSPGPGHLRAPEHLALLLVLLATESCGVELKKSS